MVRIPLTMMLLASGAGAMSAAVDGLPDRMVPWGATGIIMFMVYWILAKTVPGILKAHKDAITKLADSVDRNSQAVEKCRWRNKDDN